MPSILKKTTQLIIDSCNEYLGLLKCNQKSLLTEVQAYFQSESTVETLEKWHCRIEKRTVSICRDLRNIRAWPGLKTLIRVEFQCSDIDADMIVDTHETRYYITSLLEEVQPLAQRIRGY